MKISFRLHRSIQIKLGTYLVLRSKDQSLDILEKTLQLLKLDFLFQGDRLVINKTKTEVKLTKFANLTIVNLRLYSENDQKEKYLRTVLIKYLS